MDNTSEQQGSLQFSCLVSHHALRTRKVHVIFLSFRVQILQIDNTSEDIKRTSETIARILQPYKIRVAHKPITTWRQLLTNIKDKDESSDRQGAVKKIKCCDCQATYITYISETGRNLIFRLNEHKRATGNGDINNQNAVHHLKTNHRIDGDSAECVT